MIPSTGNKEQNQNSWLTWQVIYQQEVTFQFNMEKKLMRDVPVSQQTSLWTSVRKLAEGEDQRTRGSSLPLHPAASGLHPAGAPEERHEVTSPPAAHTWRCSLIWFQLFWNSFDIWRWECRDEHRTFFTGRFSVKPVITQMCLYLIIPNDPCCLFLFFFTLILKWIICKAVSKLLLSENTVFELFFCPETCIASLTLMTFDCWGTGFSWSF